MRLRQVAIVILSLLLVLVLLAGAGVLWAMSLDYRSYAEHKGSEALGRQVTIGALKIGWGDPLSIEIRDLRIANADWGTRPEMASVEHILALVDLWPLLDGTIRYRRLEVTRPDILLERDDKGTGNWKFAGGGGADGGGGGGLGLMPKDRTQFPTLLDFALQTATVTYRTSSGKPLVIALKQATVQTPDDDQPVMVTAEGAYNDLPARLEATTDSFVRLRDASVPFVEAFTLANEDSRIAFEGPLMNPLDFDGIDKAALTIETRNFGKLLEAFDAGLSAAFPVKLNGALSHQGNRWQIDGITGTTAENPVTGRFVLDEGPRGGTDKMAVTARYDTLVLDSMLGKQQAKTDWKSIELQLPEKTAPAIQADLAAKRLKYGKTTLPGFALVGSAAPGAVDIDSVKFAMAGTSFEANGTAKRDGKATRLHLNAGLPGGNLAELLKTLGAATTEIAGKVSARIALDAHAAKLGEILSQGQGSAVFAMTEGKVSRDVLEKASVDLRTIFRKGEGMSAVKCLLGIAVVKDGVAQISPLILRTPEATLTGGGTIDLAKNAVDLTIRSDPKSTGFFALDIPIRISGGLDAPKAAPDSKSKFEAGLALPELPKPIRKVAEESRCLEG
ncbi:AsmA-like C-terminal region-containing protein [Dongia sp.]|uniref:AsmA family protein n=1 Tax=Dongia sp. TaxID=1977262 RepID=UPI0037513397